MTFVMLLHHPDTGFLVITNDIPQGEKNDFGESALEKVQRIKQMLRFAENTKLLLVFAWCTDAQLQKVVMNLEVMCWDVTHKTNKEKRKLMTCGMKDGDN